MERITSRENPQIKRMAKLLASRKAREEEKAFVCEGTRLVLDGVASGETPLLLLVTEQAITRYPALEEVVGTAERTLLISDELAARLGDTRTPQGVFALFKKLDNWKTAVTIKSGGGKRSFVLLSKVQDPGNVGAVMRSCEAMGVDGLLLSDDCADLYSPKTLRAGMGAVFRLPVRVCENIAAEISALRKAGVAVYAAALRPDAKRLGRFDFPAASAVVIGNEGGGLDDDIINACDNTVLIPMAGGAESLNAGVAAGILIWELCGKREE